VTEKIWKAAGPCGVITYTRDGDVKTGAPEIKEDD